MTGLLWAATASARPIVADLAQRSIDISTNFNGVDILLFGARNDAGDIVVAVRGPMQHFVVRKKERFLGIWINQEKMEFESEPGFYSLSSSRPLTELKNEALLSALEIGPERLHFANAEPNEQEREFAAAFVKNRQAQGLYNADIAPVTFWGDTLFRTVLNFPNNIPGGIYSVETYLFNDGLLLSVQETPLHVSKIGFEAFVFQLAHQHNVFYGFMSVAIALVAGWAASLIFQRI